MSIPSLSPELWLVSNVELLTEYRNYLFEFPNRTIEDSFNHFFELKNYVVKGEPNGEHSSELYDLVKYIDWSFSQKSTPCQGKYISNQFPEMTLNEVSDILDTTIVKDRTSKLVSFITTLLTYTNQDQLAIAFQAGSSTGKSYIALNVVNLFPIEDTIKLDYATPKTFFHMRGHSHIYLDGELFPILSRSEYIDREIENWDLDNPIPDENKTNHRDKRRAKLKSLKEEWNNLEKVTVVDLERRILVFKDMPHDELLRQLRPLVSHDEKIHRSEIADKKSSGQIKTKTIFLNGYCTFIFCSASYSQDEQERTRMLLLSPDIDSEKLDASCDMVFERNADKETFDNTVKSDEGRSLLKQRIRAIKESGIQEIVIPRELLNYLKERFYEKHSIRTPKMQRDIPHLIAMVKGHALLNLWHRERNNHSIVVNEVDVKAGLELYEPISQANDWGVPPQVYNFYNSVLKKKIDDSGISREEFKVLWYDEFKERLGYKRMKSLIYLMNNAGMIIEKQNPDDKRLKKIYLPEGGIHLAKKM